MEKYLCKKPAVVEQIKVPTKASPAATAPVSGTPAKAASGPDNAPVAMSRRRRRRRAAIPQKTPAHKNADPLSSAPVAKSWEDGVYLLVVGFTSSSNANGNVTFDVHMTVDMKSDYGYLSAGDYPKVRV